MSWLHRIADMPQGLRLDGQLDDLERRIFALLNEFVTETNGPTLRVSGGWVRDKLLNKESHDIDITVEGTSGLDFAKTLKAWADKKYGPKVMSTPKGNEARPEQLKSLAVAFIRIYGQDIELTPVRGDEKYDMQGGHAPTSVNLKASPEQDAFRRDLSINSLFYNIQTGSVEDLTGQGYDDLQNKILRPPCRRGLDLNDEIGRVYREDPVRVLRLFRFNSQYPEFKIDPTVSAYIKEDTWLQDAIVRKIHDPQAALGTTTERTAKEMRKLMQGKQPDIALKAMWDTGMLQRMMGLPMEDLDQQNEHHDLPLMQHTWAVIRNMNAIAREEELNDNERGLMNFAALGHDLGKFEESVQSHDGTNMHYYQHEDASQLKWEWFADALKLSNEETDFVSAVVGNHIVPHTHQRSGIDDRKLREFLGEHPRLYRYYYLIAKADAKSKQAEPDSSVGQFYDDMLRNRIPSLPGVQLNNGVASFPTLLNGKEIMDITRIPPGPKIKEILQAVRTAQYNNFGQGDRNIPLEEAKQRAREIVLKYRQMPINGQDIMDVVGLPGKPPKGRVSYIEIVKQEVNKAMDLNPSLSREQALAIVQQMMSSGQFDPYQTS